MNSQWTRKHSKWLAILLTLMFVVELLPHASAQNPPCAWTNGPAEHRSNQVLMGIGAGFAVAAFFFPPLLLAGLVIGGMGAINEGVMAMSQC